MRKLGRRLGEIIKLKKNNSFNQDIKLSYFHFEKGFVSAIKNIKKKNN